MNLFSFHVSVIVLVNEDRLSNTTTTYNKKNKNDEENSQFVKKFISVMKELFFFHV